jgi:hypothetical protein
MRTHKQREYGLPRIRKPLSGTEFTVINLLTISIVLAGVAVWFTRSNTGFAVVNAIAAAVCGAVAFAIMLSSNPGGGIT